MPPHAHGGGDEEEIIVVRTDGPPFYDIKAKQGQGFDVDYERMAKYLGPNKIALADFLRDMELINKAYVPTALASHKWLQYGSAGMGGSFVSFIIMGILGEDFGVTADVRGLIIPLIMIMFLLGVVCFTYSKFIEQPGIKEGSVLVKRVIDEQINPRHATSAARIRYTVRVNVQKKSSIHLGQTFVERPIVTIWALRSENDQGVMTDWVLPSILSQGGLITTKDAGAASPSGGDTPKASGKSNGVRKVGAASRKGARKTGGAAGSSSGANAA